MQYWFSTALELTMRLIDMSKRYKHTYFRLMPIHFSVNLYCTCSERTFSSMAKLSVFFFRDIFFLKEVPSCRQTYNWYHLRLITTIKTKKTAMRLTRIIRAKGKYCMDIYTNRNGMAIYINSTKGFSLCFFI